MVFFAGPELWIGGGGPVENALVGVLGLGLFLDFAWFREQFCTVLCPYARFQAVLTDAHTVQVGYDVKRGEPRGRAGTTTGDCIDCHKCVAVCPTAIDIRDGFQLECIGCARCIDACDSIMDRIGKPRGLIRYDSLERLLGAKTRLFRPRVIVYSVLLVAVAVALFVGLGTRPTLDLAVLRPAGEPFMVLPGRIVSNHFTLSLQNMTAEPRLYRVAVAGPPDAGLIMPGNPVSLKGGEMRRVEAFVVIPGAAAESGHVPLNIQVYEDDKLRAERQTTFLAPTHHEEEDEEDEEDHEKRDDENHEERERDEHKDRSKD
jgi:cytochrome c oxidase accessory protein FixG